MELMLVKGRAPIPKDPLLGTSRVMNNFTCTEAVIAVRLEAFVADAQVGALRVLALRVGRAHLPPERLALVQV